MTLQELLERVEGASKGSYQLDSEIAIVIAGWTYEAREMERKKWWRAPGKEWFFRTDSPPKFSSSLDAALVLVEQQLPGWYWKLNSDGNAVLMQEDTLDGVMASSMAPTPALALCAALIRAKIAEAAQ